MNDDHEYNLLNFGYSIVKNSNTSQLIDLQNNLIKIINQFTSKNIDSLEMIHMAVSHEKINDLRLLLIEQINKNNSIKLQILESIKPLLIQILGPDIATQRNVNLVINQPNDPTSQIPLHADTLTGHSIFELVIWIPLTRVFNTQGMFIMQVEEWKKNKHFWDLDNKSIKNLLSDHDQSFTSICMNPFDILLFWHHLPHGNVINTEDISRCSLNFRVKSLFTPFNDKGLGDYFYPWNISPFTKLALEGLKN
jgi:sporadic carbohydrate cluster 2OG-Fe(II) oxygenase